MQTGFSGNIDPQYRAIKYFLCFFIAGVLATAFAGCATYSPKFRSIEDQLSGGDPQQALDFLEKQRVPRTNRLLYFLDKAILLRMNKQYKESNQALETAKDIIDELYGISIREKSSSFLINDNTRSYAGDDHDKVLIHLFAALNYLQLGKPDSARVEALQVDQTLKAIAEKKTEDNPAIYVEDPFSRYLSAMIFEELGEWSDALIDYRKAYQAYVKYADTFELSVPSFLKKDLLRLTEHQGLHNEMRQYQKEFNINSWDSVQDRKKLGELIVIIHNGLAPIKREAFSAQPNPETGTMLSIALPYYESRHYAADKIKLSVDDTVQQTEMVENIESIARKTLEAQLPAITIRAVARMVIKENTKKKAREEGGMLLGFMADVAGVLTERADTRSWLTLPENIQMARIPLTPGTYNLDIELFDQKGKLLKIQKISEVIIRASEKTYVEYHWLNPMPTMSFIQ